ncbi:MAG: TetR/AcrR family transcriptional regulator [Alphaproteobacteria bacterium]|nr:TetR/AcrR family transcriptional regulator [Alphaproteobacteria bacterium]MCB9695237.1 TetR/AcrR family transcriptional regulator [Alphaproteobacteria bacterium]
MPRAFTEAEREHVRARLLTAAREAVPRTGMRRTPVDALTRAAGISKGAFYLFFESKEALWTALMQEGETRARARLGAEAADPRPGATRRVLQAMFEIVGSDPVLAAMRDPEELAWLERSFPPGLLAAARADDDAFFGELHDRLVARGEAMAESREAFVGLPLVALGLAQQGGWLGGREPVVRELLVDALARRLTSGA